MDLNTKRMLDIHCKATAVIFLEWYKKKLDSGDNEDKMYYWTEDVRMIYDEFIKELQNEED